MKIKKGDKVKILAGKDKGKSGKVLQVFPSRQRASVEGVNLLIKHLRPRRQGEKGQRVEFPAPLHISNLMLICPKCNKPTRVGYLVNEVDSGVEKKKKKKKLRQCKRCQATFE
ncbi:50S ribosomal protein L24 [Candidatus Parcubacteria bacterium]|nr:MAG: 50S ribosomal protein L24 [Candidatus Parcubacteria bacterium]